MCASIQFTLSIQSVRLDLYTCYRITRVLLIFHYFQVFVFFSWAHSIYFGTGNRETKARDLTSFQKDLRLDRYHSFVKLFVPMVVCNRVLSCLLLYSLFTPLILYLNLQCRVHAEEVCRICSDSVLPERLAKYLKCGCFLPLRLSSEARSGTHQASSIPSVILLYAANALTVKCRSDL